MKTLITAAANAAGAFGGTSPQQRRTLLYDCAAALESAATDVVATTAHESGLGEQRLRGELDRTTGQLRLLGDFVASGRHLPGIESPEAAPGGADIRMTSVPIGVVAVFAASNFPLAFGVAGGDTAAALAAGCPVVVKAHPAQPRTSAMIGELLRESLPEGVFGLIEGDNATSIALVTDPHVRAVGFTGSLAGGRAMMDAAAARPDPIPVYAEMGSLNPIFVLPDAATVGNWATMLAGAVTASAGQLCTKPGLIVVPDSPAGAALESAIAAGIAAAAADHPMLTEGMADGHDRWREQAEHLPAATVTAGQPGQGTTPFCVHVTDAQLSDELLNEHFGPTTVICRAAVDRYCDIAATVDGSLTATVLGTEVDHQDAAPLVTVLSRRAGRLVWNGVPTGVAVCDAMLHGGPWPATSAPLTTSVGTAAIQRFRRPVAVQGLPAALAEAVTVG
jgi:acyl-CoA reductase-like NAD-dependent aldehyde dehydrogenase